MIPRALFQTEHHQFRARVAGFIAQEIAPHYARWEQAGIVDRELWLKAGAAGLLCPNIAPAHGGAGASYLHNVVTIEELAKALVTGPAFTVHSDVVASYINTFGSEEQKATWLPNMVSGRAVGALALTEPTAGSDLKGIRTTAIREGSEYVINGQKTYIANGHLCDVVVVASRRIRRLAGEG